MTAIQMSMITSGSSNYLEKKVQKEGILGREIE